MTTPGRVALVVNALVIAFTVPVLFGVRYPPLVPYPWDRVLHVTGAVLLLGNLVVGPAWVLLALREDGAVRRFAFRTLGWMDVLFTMPGVALLALTGLPMATRHGGVLARPWLHQSVLILLGVWGLSLTVVLYWQERVLRLAAAGDAGPAFRRALTWWSIWGTLIMLPLGAVFYLMVTQRSLW